ADSPTSPSREVSIERLVEDLRNLSKLTKYVYFAVDAMSPRFVKKLCAAIIDNEIDLRWSAELRLEKTFFDKTFGRMLRKAGCVAISFGYESGSQRVLDLIDKGVQISGVPAVLRELADNNIGAQMMGFVGFPSETPEEARTTFQFLLDNVELWT